VCYTHGDHEHGGESHVVHVPSKAAGEEIAVTTFGDLVKTLVSNPHMSRDEVEVLLNELAVAELASEEYEADLMAKAYSASGGDEEAAAALYLKLRVEQLGDKLIEAIEQTIKEAEEIARRDGPAE